MVRRSSKRTTPRRRRRLTKDLPRRGVDYGITAGFAVGTAFIIYAVFSRYIPAALLEALPSVFAAVSGILLLAVSSALHIARQYGAFDTEYPRKRTYRRRRY